MLLIKLICDITSLISEWLSLSFHFIIVMVENITWLDAKIMEKLTIILLSLPLSILLHLHLLQLLILDFFEHLLLSLSLLNLLLCTFLLHFFNFLKPLFISHIQFSPHFSARWLVSASHRVHTWWIFHGALNILVSCNGQTNRLEGCLLTHFRFLRHWLVRDARVMRSLRHCIFVC